MKSYQQHFITGTEIVFVLLFSMAACNNEKSNTAESATENANTSPSKQLVFDKLTGTWLSEDGKSFERWTKNDDGTFRYFAFIVKGNDTSWNEQANVYPENDKWVFENIVKGQNDGKAVKFISSSFSENSIQFSNPAHDFPTDINYTVADANTINAFIVGPSKNGGKDTIPFNFTRVKQ